MESESDEKKKKLFIVVDKMYREKEKQNQL